jgi:hypothetical protein
MLSPVSGEASKIKGPDEGAPRVLIAQAQQELFQKALPPSLFAEKIDDPHNSLLAKPLQPDGRSA